MLLFVGLVLQLAQQQKSKHLTVPLKSARGQTLLGKQLLIACAVGIKLPLMALLGVDEIDGVFLAVLVFFFLIPFLVMVLIFRSSISSHGLIQHNRSLHLRKKQKKIRVFTKP